MRKHRFELRPGNETEGVTIRSLLNGQLSKRTNFPCPFCDSLIEVPETLEPHLRELTDKLGRDTAYVLVEFYHPGDVPKTKTPPRLSEKEEQDLKKRSRPKA